MFVNTRVLPSESLGNVVLVIIVLVRVVEINGYKILTANDRSEYRTLRSVSETPGRLELLALTNVEVLGH